MGTGSSGVDTHPQSMQVGWVIAARWDSYAGDDAHARREDHPDLQPVG